MFPSTTTSGEVACGNRTCTADQYTSCTGRIAGRARNYHTMVPSLKKVGKLVRVTSLSFSLLMVEIELDRYFTFLAEYPTTTT